MLQERALLAKAHKQRVTDCNKMFVPAGAEPFRVPETWTWFRAEAISGFITKGTTPHSSLLKSKKVISLSLRSTT